MNKVWARKSWTLVDRFSPKMLAHGLGMLGNVNITKSVEELFLNEQSKIYTAEPVTDI
jgi:hypothetical protein